MTHVLVVDDEPDIRDLIAEALLDEGYDVACAANGVAALEQIRQRMPNIAILDLMMPELDGRAFLHECRANARYAPLKVIIITASSLISPNELDAEAVFAKPFDLSALVDTVVSLAPPI